MRHFRIYGALRRCWWGSAPLTAPGLTGVVFRFSGVVPARRQVGYVDRLTADLSGRPVSIAGRAILRVRFYRAAAHDNAGRPTAPARKATLDLANIMAVVRSGDFESVVSYGIGLANRTFVHAFSLTPRRPRRDRHRNTVLHSAEGRVLLQSAPLRLPTPDRSLPG